MIASPMTALIVAVQQVLAQTAATEVDATGYIVAAWVITLGAIGAYALTVIRRGRTLSKAVPPEDRRWM